MKWQVVTVLQIWLAFNGDRTAFHMLSNGNMFASELADIPCVLDEWEDELMQIPAVEDDLEKSEPAHSDSEPLQDGSGLLMLLDGNLEESIDADSHDHQLVLHVASSSNVASPDEPMHEVVPLPSASTWHSLLSD